MKKPFVDISKLEYFKPFDGFKAKLVHSDSLTTSFWEIEKGAVLPRHSHINEQISIVTSGILELTIGNEKMKLSKGMVAVIPANIEHEGVALTDVEVTDVFYPIREDFPKPK